MRAYSYFRSDEVLHEPEVLLYRFFVQICYTKMNAYSYKLQFEASPAARSPASYCYSYGCATILSGF